MTWPKNASGLSSCVSFCNRRGLELGWSWRFYYDYHELVCLIVLFALLCLVLVDYAWWLYLFPAWGDPSTASAQAGRFKRAFSESDVVDDAQTSGIPGNADRWVCFGLGALRFAKPRRFGETGKKSETKVRKGAKWMQSQQNCLQFLATRCWQYDYGKYKYTGLRPSSSGDHWAAGRLFHSRNKQIRGI